MIIQEIKQLLQTSINPIARVMYSKDHFRVLCIGFKKDMILRDHKTPYNTKLLVIEGNVIYNQQNVEHKLSVFDEIIIPINEIHNVVALEDSLCLLIQS